MNTFQKSTLAAATILMISLGAMPAFSATEEAKKAPPGTEIVESGWTLRCPEQPKGADPKNADKKNCEAFNILKVKKNSQRIAEFAIGFPPDRKGPARGAAILPLGILLESEIVMKVDEGKPANVKIRYCTNDGCFSFMPLDKNLLNSMKTGKTLTFICKTIDGRTAKLVLNLNGLGKALQAVE